jgi:hypothetical protein
MNACRASGLLALLACLLLTGWFWLRGERFIAANGPTFDEGVHLVAGYSYWMTGKFNINAEDPPLLKLLWALPLVLSDGPPYPRETSGKTHWQIADSLLYHSDVSSRQLLEPARRVNLAVGCLLVLLVGWVSYRVWGSKLAGVVGCAFAASDPTLLALSCILSTDVGVTFFGLLTCYLLWEYVTNPSRGLLLALSVSLGLLLGTKFSALGLIAGLGLAGIVFVWRGGTLSLPGAAEPRGFRTAVEFAIRVGVIAIVVLAANYAFFNFTEWGTGLKFQLTRSRHGDGEAFLLGEVSRTGWFHYFLVALPLKLPIGLLLAASVSALSQLWRRNTQSESSPRDRGLFLIIPPLVFFALASYSRVDIGVRVVLPVLPFLYLVAAGLATPACCCFVRWLVLALSLVWCGLIAQQANPHDLAYFNELAGGSRNGVKYLADSNLDWGQSLPALKEWMNAAGVDVIYLAYFGTDRPEVYGIRFQLLPCYGRVGPPGGETVPLNAPRHVLALSANHLNGLFVNDAYAWLRDRTPVAIIDGSIYVFDLSGDAEAIARVRALSIK